MSPSLNLLLLLMVPSFWRVTEGQGKSMMSRKKGEEACPFLDGVYVSVMRRIFNPGFHKQLLSEVELMLTTSLLPDMCQLLVEETVPRGAIVDPDEMRDLRFKTGIRSYIPAKVDIEKPEFESEAYRVFIFRTLEIRENLRVTNIQIPINLRYHKPALPSTEEGQHNSGTSSGPQATVKIPNPRLLLSCQEETETLTANCSSRKVTTYCDETGTSKCEWLNIPYKINVASVEVSVPVGNAAHTSLVVGVTTCVTCGATIYLIITMFRTVKLKEE